MAIAAPRSPQSMPYKPDYRYIPPITWRFLTPLYDFLCAVSGLGERFKRKILRSVSLKDGMTVLDVGCGTGVFLALLKETYPGVKCIGIDPDQDALGIAERRLKKVRLGAELREAFAESLPIPAEAVDVCFSTLTFHHMPDEIKRRAAQEMHRVLKPGGLAVIADFGESKSRFLRKILFFEKLEYLEGNLNGAIPRYLKEAGFKEPVVVGAHFPGIQIIRARK